MVTEAIRTVVLEDKSFPGWSPPSDYRHRSFIEKVNIPALNGRPTILLQGVGKGTRHSSGKLDAHGGILGRRAFTEHTYVFRYRFAQISMCVSQVLLLHISLVTAPPGEGKTRSAVEALYREWGFFLTCSRSEGVGSAHLEVALRGIKDASRYRADTRENGVPNSTQPSSNEYVACHWIRQVLLAHLLVFREFLKASVDANVTLSSDSSKRQWNCIQLAPGDLLGRDIFEDLTMALKHARDLYLRASIARVFEEITHMLSPAPEADPPPLYVVLDEAQEAVDWDGTSVASSADPTAFPNPVLPQIVRILKTVRVHVIICGTALRAKDVEESLSSVGTSNVVCTYPSDSFSDPVSQKAFVCSFLPPNYLEEIQGGPERLFERLFTWLQGRYVCRIFPSPSTH